MKMYCDNQTAIHIAESHIFHEPTKYIEVDCYLVRQKVTEDKII